MKRGRLVLRRFARSVHVRKKSTRLAGLKRDGRGGLLARQRLRKLMLAMQSAVLDDVSDKRSARWQQLLQLELLQPRNDLAPNHQIATGVGRTMTRRVQLLMTIKRGERDMKNVG